MCYYLNVQFQGQGVNIFIYVSSQHVSGIQVLIIRRILLYLCDFDIFHRVWVASGRVVGFQSIQSDKY